MKLQLLRGLYDRAVQGLPVLGTPTEAARAFQTETSSLATAADRLTQRYVLLCGATGFACGLPGYLSMPLTIPANLAGVLLLQFHLGATLAVLAGRDPHDAAVRERVIGCIMDGRDAGPEATAAREHDREVADEEALGLLDRLGTKLGERGVRFIGEQAVQWAGRAARRSRRGTRSLPLLGGAVAGLADGYATREASRRVRRTFQIAHGV